MARTDRKPKRVKDDFVVPTTANKSEGGEKKKPEWATWEVKVETLGKRQFSAIAREWRAQIPAMEGAGNPPSQAFLSIADVAERTSKAGRAGAAIARLPGNRAAVLHEAIYMLHKAVHVQIDVADAVVKGRQTWAYVNGYQGALFALTALLGLLGVSISKDSTGSEGVLMADVWPEEAFNARSVTAMYEDEFKVVRFRELDHYQKWALLKRALRQTTFSKETYKDFSSTFGKVGDREYAFHRNQVNYVSTAWLSADLLSDQPDGPFLPAQSLQDYHENIPEVTPNAGIYTMVALVEIACGLLDEIATISPGAGMPPAKIDLLAQELAVLDRRLPARAVLCGVDWTQVP